MQKSRKEKLTLQIRRKRTVNRFRTGIHRDPSPATAIASLLVIYNRRNVERKVVIFPLYEKSGPN